MRNLLIRLSIKYNGDYNKIKKAIERRETTDDSIVLQKAITILDEIYPKELFELKQPPFVLFYEGDISLLNTRKISVVGSRNASEYGVSATKAIVKKLENYTIISGLAKGIDATAHCNAKKTIAVIGNGINVNYPYENMYLYDYMKTNQLIISEYPKDVKPAKYHFPFRNRIIAALGERLIVTQSKKKSGTMITVNEALNLNRSIYAIPYPFTNEDGQGCNILIECGANILTEENIDALFDK